MKPPLVSIIIPCYNAEAWIDGTLASALNQTWTRCEVIFVDDGSKDGSFARARNFEAQGVKAVRQENRGASAARNHGLRLAQGDFVQFLDADDQLAPDKISHQIHALENTEGDILASGEWGRFATTPHAAQFVPQAVAQARTGVEFLQTHYETGTMMQPGAWITSRRLIEKAGPWNETLSLNDDGEYFARVMLAARGIVHVPESKCYYRTGLSGSLSRRTDPPALASLFKSVELTIGHLLNADQSPRTIAACADAWMRAAFEVYPAMPELAEKAENNARQLGGPRRPLPGSGRFQLASKFLGWRLARRMFP